MPNNLILQLSAILPELLLFTGASIFLMLGLFVTQHSYRTVCICSLFLLFLDILLLFFSSSSVFVFNQALKLDVFGVYLKILVSIAGIASLLMFLFYDNVKESNLRKFELPVLMLFSMLGMFLMISAANLLILYLGLELQSLILYAFAGFDRKDAKSSEAGLKYFILGAFSSSILLYGISLIYGYTGHIGYVEISNHIATGHYNLGLIFGVIFIIAGFGFKLSAVPFHMWTPDVYEGSPLPITGFFAGAPKIAALGAFIHLLLTAFPQLFNGSNALAVWKEIVVFLILGSIILGSFSAIGQLNIKRVIAYSSITHMGYALIGLICADQYGIAAVLLYLTIYLITIIGLFAFLISIAHSSKENLNITSLGGLAKVNPFSGVVMTILMFSLAGIPPLGGFFAKWYVLSAAVHSGFIYLAIIAILSSVVGAFYYLRIIKIMWFDEAVAELSIVHPICKFLMLVSAFLLVLYVIFAGYFYNIAAIASGSLF